MKELNLAVVGATGAVGQEILKVIEERKVPYKSIKMLASSRSAGKKLQFMGKEYTVEETTLEVFKGVDVTLFAGGPASRAFGRDVQAMGTVVIDNSSTFRLEDDVPLIIPEVNGDAAKDHQGLIASPNCSTTLLVGAINPLHRKAGIKRIILSTYQAVSGAGAAGLSELEEQTRQILNGEPIHPDVFQHQIAFNLIPHIDVWQEADYSKEETKVIHETHKILSDKDMAITVTAVRVPVMRSHAESIYLEFEEKLSPDEARDILQAAPRVVLQDAPQDNIYPMPITATGSDDIFVGRIRRDLYNDHALNMWACFDQIRKGAATNTVQILELLLEKNWI